MGWEMVENGDEWWRMGWEMMENDGKWGRMWWEMMENGEGWRRMVENGVGNDGKWGRMVENGVGNDGKWDGKWWRMVFTLWGIGWICVTFTRCCFLTRLKRWLFCDSRLKSRPASILLPVGGIRSSRWNKWSTVLRRSCRTVRRTLTISRHSWLLGKEVFFTVNGLILH